MRKLMAYLGVSLASSFVFAISWVTIMTLTLPETDEAHGQMPFQDPGVLPIMSIIAVVSGIVVWPFYALLGWRLPPVRAGMTVGIATLVFIAAATPFSARMGWLGSYPVLLISLIACRFTMAQNGRHADG